MTAEASASGRQPRKVAHRHSKPCGAPEPTDDRHLTVRQESVIMAGNPKKRAKEQSGQTDAPALDPLDLLKVLSTQDLDKLGQAWLMQKGIDPRSLAALRKWDVLPVMRLGWMPKFLMVLRDTGNVRSACTAAGISRAAVDAALAHPTDEVFKDWYNEALEDAVDMLEMSAWSLASRLDGSMIRFLLTAHRPNMYAKQIRLGGAEGAAPIQVNNQNTVAVYLPSNGRGDRPVDTDVPRLTDAQPVIDAEAFQVVEPGSIPDEAWDVLDDEEDEE